MAFSTQPAQLHNLSDTTVFESSVDSDATAETAAEALVFVKAQSHAS